MSAAVVDRIKAAGLLTVAESAAKRAGLRLKDCVASGDVTGGHAALWRGLFKAGKTTAEIAALVGFPEFVVRDELKIRATPEAGVDIAALVAAAVKAAVAPLRAELDALRASVRALTAAPLERPTTVSFDADLWLAERGVHGQRLREIFAAHSTTPAEVLARPKRGVLRTNRIVKARRAAVVYLTGSGCSQPDIGAILRIDRTSVYHAQVQAGVVSALRRGRPCAH